MTSMTMTAPDQQEPVLVVDDEPRIGEVLARTLETMGHEWEISSNGEDALAAVRRRLFALVLSDIRMPGMDGVHLLRCIVSDCPHTAVIMVTAVADVDTAVSTMRLGACDYIVKPFDLDDVAQRIRRALAHRRQLLDVERYQAQLESEVAERTSEVRKVFLGAVQSLAAALDARDGYTHGHSRRVTALSVALARHLGLPEASVERIRLAGMLHDIGKIGIRESVLNKPSALTEDEYAHIRTHPVIAQDILEPILWEQETVRLIRAHHERYDGNGYPDGLAGEHIPLGARILAVADAFDAMTSERSYRDPMSREQALAVLRHGCARQWDPLVVETLERLPPGLWRLWEDARNRADEAALSWPLPDASQGRSPGGG
jgi:putative nucleotidyltransferase with HDIG domain